MTTMSEVKSKRVNHAARKYGIRAIKPFKGGGQKVYWWDGRSWTDAEAGCMLYTKVCGENTLQSVLGWKQLADYAEYDVVRLVR